MPWERKAETDGWRGDRVAEDEEGNVMPIRMTPSAIADFEREALARGGTSSGHVPTIQPPMERVETPTPPELSQGRLIVRNDEQPNEDVTYYSQVATAVMFIPNWIPQSLNKQIGVHWATKAKIKRETKDLISAVASVQCTPCARGRRRVDVHFILGPGKRKMDKDNAKKSILDALKHAGLIRDDNDEWLEEGKVSFSRAAKFSGLSGTMILLTDV